METITATLKIDDAQAEKKLEQLREKIAKMEKKLGEATEKQTDLDKKAEEAARAYNNAADALKEMVDRQAELNAIDPTNKDYAKRIKEQESVVAKLGKEAEKINEKAKKASYTVEKTTEDLAYAKEHAGQLAQQLSHANTPAAALNKRIKKIGTTTESILKRIKGLFRRVLFFSVIAKGIRMIRDYVMDVIKVTPAAQEAIAELKGALLTLAYPVINFVLPKIIWAINFITKLVKILAGVVSSIFGSTYESSAKAAEALKKETDALNATGSAAKEAKKQLAGFDELNILSDTSTSASASGDIGTTFDTDPNWLSNWLGDKAKLVTVATIVAGIGLIVFGIITKKLKLLLAGALLIKAGIYIGEETGVLDENWLQKFLDKVTAFDVLIVELLGIAFVVFGICLKNIGMILSGAVLIGAGIYAAAKSESFQNWWEVLKLTDVMMWLDVAVTLAGIAAIAIGAFLGAAGMKWVIAGAVILGVEALGALNGSESKKSLGNLWQSLGLQSLVSKASAALLAAGVALIAFGAATGNVMLVIAGCGLLGESVSLYQSTTTAKASATGYRLLDGYTVTPKVTGYASGTVVPPNREFLGLLGDNKYETEVVSPLSTMKQAFLEAMRESGGGSNKPVNIYLDGKLLATSTTKYQTQYARAKG